MKPTSDKTDSKNPKASSFRRSTLKLVFIIAASVSLFSLLLALFISELIISHLYPQNTYKIAKIGVVSVFKNSELLPFELQPKDSTHHIAPTHEFQNDITTNGLGYRGPEFSFEKPTDITRILMLGDSTTFGIGSNDDQTFPVVLENLLRERSLPAEVINAGFASGLSPDTYYLYLRQKVLKLKPDIVFVNLFLANDITDLFENDWPKVDDHGLPLKIVSKERQIDRQGRLVFRQKDWKYRLPIIRNLHVGILTLNLIEQKLPRVETFIRWLVNAPDLLEHIPQSEKDRCLYLNECTDRFQAQWDRLNLIFQGFKQLSEERQIPIVITLMPAPFQLTARPEREEAELNLTVKIPEGEDTNQNYPQMRLITKLDELNLPYFDLLKSLRENLNPQTANDYVYKDDGHYTPAGNQAIAQGYLDYLLQNTQLFN